MSAIDIALQIGTGVIAGVTASLVLLGGRHVQQRRKRRRQIAVVRDHFIKEFSLLADMEGPPSEQDHYKDAVRHDLAPDSWGRLLNTVNHLTGSLNEDERAALYSALHFLQTAHGHHAAGTRALSVEHLREQYHVVAYTIGPGFDLPTNPQWGSPLQAPTENKTV